jgi:hypothetical protein
MARLFAAGHTVASLFRNRNSVGRDSDPAIAANYLRAPLVAFEVPDTDQTC